jgi:signal transduction histidine kinase
VPETDTLVVELAAGGRAEERRALVLPVDGTLPGAAYRTGGPVATACLADDDRFADKTGDHSGLGPAVAVPLGTAEHGLGVLLLVRSAGEPVFTDSEIDPLLVFAGQAAVALELAERRRDTELLTLLEDRDRIARDLHDLAIQRLFATGMTLQSAARLVDHAGAAERLTRAVGDLDETIKIIRTTIFGLRVRGEETGRSLRARAARSAGEAASALGFPPRLSMEGLLDTDVPPAVADHVHAVLGELLSNAARHAHATRVEVDLQATADEVILTVTDNGRGIGSDGRRSGLRNLSERAQGVGGTFTIEMPAGGGSRFVWRAPLLQQERN